MQELEADIRKLYDRIDDALETLDIEKKRKKLGELKEQMKDPNFWDDNQRAARISKQAARIKEDIDKWKGFHRTAAELLDLVKMDDDSIEDQVREEYQVILKEFESQEYKLMLGGKYDEMDAIMSIHAGTGGTDAQDWSEMLKRMYLRYFEKQDFKAQIVDESRGDEAGIKSVTMTVEGDYAYGLLKSEHGVHRLVRQSPFNADNLRQTSFALVEVTPQIEEKEVDIDENDLRIDVFRAGGHGGQSVNTTDSAVRITHEPTGTVVSIQNERSQTQNKETAMKILKSKLVALAQEQRKEKLSELKGPTPTEQWGSQIRNYVLHPYKLVKDTRTNLEVKDTDKVLDGDIQDFIEAYLRSEMGD